MNTLRYFLALTLTLLHIALSGQEIKQKIEMDIDSIGNATITLTMDMNAAQWQVWLQSFGNNPAALKREIQRSMPGFFLDDFNLDKNDMERNFQLSLKAYGVCKVDKSGKWYVETDDKDIELTDLGGGKFMYVHSPTEYAGQMQQTTFVSFPKEAGDIKVDEDAFGKKVFEFQMQGAGDKPNWFRWAGIFMLLVSAVFTVITYKKS